MSPYLTLTNKPDSRGTDIHDWSKFETTKGRGKNISDFSLIQDCSSMLFAFRLSIGFNHISRVVSVGSRFKMYWIYAKSIMTNHMSNNQPFRYFSFCQFISNYVSWESRFFHPKLTILAPTDSPCPYPAVIKIGTFTYFTPKPFLKGSSGFVAISGTSYFPAAIFAIYLASVRSCFSLIKRRLRQGLFAFGASSHIHLRDGVTPFGELCGRLVRRTSGSGCSFPSRPYLYHLGAL